MGSPGRPEKTDDDKQTCVVRTYVTPEFYKRLEIYCKKNKHPSISFTARSLLEQIDLIET